jgi:hypothetical protein
MKFRYRDKDHKYFLDGTEIPSLSAVISHYFGSYEDFTDGAAADRGSRIHKACEYFVQGRVDENSLKTKHEDISGYVLAFEKFLQDHRLINDIPHPEVKKYITYPETINPQILWMGCGMRLDLAFKRSRVVVEIKSGIPAKPQYFGFSREDMQLNTQIKAMSSPRKPPETWRGFLLYIKRNGKYKAIEKKFDTNMWSHFVMAWHGWYNKHKGSR